MSKHRNRYDVRSSPIHLMSHTPGYVLHQPSPSNSTVARTEGYTNTANVWASLVQFSPFSILIRSDSHQTNRCGCRPMLTDAHGSDVRNVQRFLSASATAAQASTYMIFLMLLFVFMFAVMGRDMLAGKIAEGNRPIFQDMYWSALTIFQVRQSSLVQIAPPSFAHSGMKHEHAMLFKHRSTEITSQELIWQG